MTGSCGSLIVMTQLAGGLGARTICEMSQMHRSMCILGHFLIRLLWHLDLERGRHWW